MIAKISSVLGFGLVTAVTGQAMAHDGDDCHQGGDRSPATYRAPVPPPAVYTTPVDYTDGYRGNRPSAAGHSYGYRAEAHEAGELGELRRADFNRDGWVTFAEAEQYARRDFWRSDRDQNRVLTWREIPGNEMVRDDRDRNGAVTYGEYREAFRRSFYRFDTNRDGVLAGYELRQPLAPRAAGWRR